MSPATKRRQRSNKLFTRKHYSSNDGFLTAIWGPPLWHFLHTMSFNYPVNPTSEQKQKYRDFILSLKYILPCGKCRKNLVKNLAALPFKQKHMESRETFSRYMYLLHEQVNTMLGKKSGLSYQDVRERYEHFRARCKPSHEVEPLKENGCVEPIYGVKSKCLLNIVPQENTEPTLTIDPKCKCYKKAA